MSYEYITESEYKKRCEEQYFDTLELIDPSRYAEMVNAVRYGKMVCSEYVDPKLCVSKYHRSAAGTKHPYGLRSLEALYQTSVYLLGGIFDQVSKTQGISARIFTIYYVFAEERFRAIRQEVLMHNTKDWLAVLILEYAVEFYVSSHYVSRLLYRKSESQRHIKLRFDKILNTQRLIETLSTLLNMYDYYNHIQWSRKRRTIETIWLIVNCHQNYSYCDNRELYLSHDMFPLYEQLYKNFLQRNYYRLLYHISLFHTVYPLIAMAFHAICLDGVHERMVESLVIACKSRSVKLRVDSLTDIFFPCPRFLDDFPYKVKKHLIKFVRHRFIQQGFHCDEFVHSERSKKEFDQIVFFKDLWFEDILGSFSAFNQ